MDGNSKKRLREFHPEPKQRLTYGILLAELGQKHPAAKKLHAIDALEIPYEHDTDAFRAVYTEFDNWIYVLHCFKKKSTQGIRTPKRDIETIRKRLKVAQLLHAKEKRNTSRTE